jgi:hypothetical protein
VIKRAFSVLALLGLAVASGTVASPSLAQAHPDIAAHDGSNPLEKEPVSLRYAIEVTVLHATNTGKGIDKRVGDMPELQKPPFSSYDTYQLLAKKRLPLEKQVPQTYHLPNGRVLRTDLKEQPQGQTFKISASINQPKGKAFLPLLEVRAGLGQAFIVAGQTYGPGILVLVFRVVKA